MARITAFAPLDMMDGSLFFGTLTHRDAARISVSGADWTNSYLGDFGFPAPGIVTGTIHTIERSGTDGLLMRMSELGTDAYGVATALQANRLDLLYSTLLFGSDRIVGSSGDDVLAAMAGTDTLRGRAGDDTLMGDEGGDHLLGGAGHDLLLGDTGADLIRGGGGNDALAGGDEDDRLSGGSGDDRIDGETGDDVLTGGAGADSFHFLHGGGHDVVRDFDPAEGDRLILDTEFGLVGLSHDAIVQEFGHVTPAGHLVLGFGEGDRIVLKFFDDPAALSGALGLF